MAPSTAPASAVSAGPLRARREDIAALCNLALRTLDVLATRGEETSDVPRLWLDATLRWARGAEGPRATVPYTRLLRALRGDLGGLLGHLGVVPPALLSMCAVCEKIHQERSRRDGHARPIPILYACGRILRDVTAEPEDDAVARARVWFWEAVAAERRSPAPPAWAAKVRPQSPSSPPAPEEDR